MTFNDLPAVNACLNGTSAVLLGIGYYHIKRQNQIAHRNCMAAALLTSTLFLISYLTYHFAVRKVTIFRDPQWLRPIYLTILLPHTILAAAIVPLVIMTATRAFRARFDKHRRIARWTLPLWMYV